MTIDERNQIRAAAQLPLLNVPTEMARLARVEADARFEEYFARRRGEFAHLWSDRSRGFWTRAAMYGEVRRSLRNEMMQV